MRRWLVLLFAALLPLQFAWSAASAYCQHETGRHETEAIAQPARHFGHHVHEHANAADAKTSTASKLLADPDCASCQAASTPFITCKADAPMLAASADLGTPPTARPFTSALARAPDRPQWLRLV